MAFTSTLCGAFSLESALVRARPAARLTLVGVELAPGALAPMLSTLTTRPHLRSRMPGSARRQQADGGEQLEVEVALPVLVGHRVERLGVADAGIVHHDVDLAEIGHDLLPGVGDRLRLGDVAGIDLDLGVGLAGGLCDLGLGRGQRVGLARQQRHRGARSGEFLGHGEAQAGARAGDHGHAAVHAYVHCFPLRWSKRSMS